MPANGNRPTWRPEDKASVLMPVSELVEQHVQNHKQPGEAIDDTLRRLLSLAPRKRLEKQ